MNFIIKILGAHNSKLEVNNVFRLKEVSSIIEKRYGVVPEVSHTSKTEDLDFFYLVFGSILPIHYEEIKRIDKNSFYFSSSFNAFRYLLDEFRLEGFCDIVHYSANSPCFYGKKQVLEKMEALRFGKQEYGDTPTYVQACRDDEKGILEFIFDYIELLRGLKM